MNEEAAVHEDPLKPRNRGQETMPWREIETIANATVFIKGESRSEKGALEPHAGTGTLISHAGGLWLLTAKSVLNKETSLGMFSVHFGYIDKEQPGDSLKASDLIKPDTWHSHGEEGFISYSFVAVNEDNLKSVLKKLPVPIYWDVVDTFSQHLERYDHLYTVHYPDPEHKGEHRRCFGGDAIFGTQGAVILCTMSTWDGSDGAPLFMTNEKTGKPQLVGIYNYSRKHPQKGAGDDEALANIGCNIRQIKTHVATGQWNKKDIPDKIRVQRFV